MFVKASDISEANASKQKGTLRNNPGTSVDLLEADSHELKPFLRNSESTDVSTSAERLNISTQVLVKSPSIAYAVLCYRSMHVD